MPTLRRNHRISVQKRNLISLPKEIREILEIKEGDVLEISVEGNKIIMEPYKLIPASQAYFWAKNTQKDMSEAKNDVEAGRIREFSNFKEFMDGLKND